ncbi:uncharacterized protein PRCAT00001172001 [Priceomyces carsonii]|uniref:uncharacterized protein n=1 Tax=Priceomyces carsonii TaxID=28549 RepID=UPI002ED954CB|nr:unnamed protein product [Priceomyces carsonii]
MKVPKVTGIFLVVLLSLTILNFLLMYYTYFVLVVSSVRKTADGIDAETQGNGKIPHPHELFVPLLTFIPTRSPVLTRPWVLLTCSFIEIDFISLSVSFLLLFYLGKYLENMWGSREFTKFVMINIIVPNLCIYFYYTLKSNLLGTDEYPPVVLSSMGVNMGFFMAIKQRISNHYFLFFKGNLRIKVTYVPFIALSFFFILSLISEECKITFLLGICGFFTSWVYLRLFKFGTNDRKSYLLPFSLHRKKSDNKFKVMPTGKRIERSQSTTLHIDNAPLKGDRSEQFSFYTLFPYPLSIIVKVMSNSIFLLLTRFKILNKEDFAEFDIDGEDPFAFEDMDNLQSNLFGLSSLRGAEGVSAIPSALPTLKRIWDWLTSREITAKTFNINTNMDKRRKLALKELE